MQKIIIYFIVCTALTACAYKPDIQQGNIVTSEMVAQLQPGMDKRQVRFIMGSPMLTDAFHENRWDYYYGLTPGRKETLRHRVTLFFSGDQLTSIEQHGDIPSDAVLKGQTRVR